MGAHFGLGLFNLFKKIPEPTVPIRRPERNLGVWQDWRPAHVSEYPRSRCVPKGRALEKVDWKEEGF